MDAVGLLEIIPFPGVITEVVVVLKGGLLQTNILESFEWKQQWGSLWEQLLQEDSSTSLG